jgi:hypothetical protein
LKLWNDCFHADLAQESDEDDLARRLEGEEVGALARQRFPGVLVTAGWDELGKALEDTQRLMADPQIPAIHEAAFEWEGVMARVDILRRNEDGTWDVIEVKSVGEAEEVHRLDVAFQGWLLRRAGIPVARTWLMVLNKNYRLQGGTLDLEHLFRMIETSAHAERNAARIEEDVCRFKALLKAGQPLDVTPSKHCTTPYNCAYLSHCTARWPKPPVPVEWMPRYGIVRGMEAHAQGIHSLFDIPERDLKSDLQRRVRACYETQSTWVGPGLAKALEAFQFPIHFLDFEALSSAIPRLEGSGPYEAIPFQWSCHTLDAEGRMTHHEYLVEDTGYPREKLFTALLEVLGEAGSICVYSHYEKRMFDEAIRVHPQMAPRLQAVINRMVDLLPMVREHVYHPGFQGSFSIKSVLPALVPELSYKQLKVQDGLAAVRGFLDMLGTADPVERASKRQDLLAYCGLDTMAMVKVREALIKLAQPCGGVPAGGLAPGRLQMAQAAMESVTTDLDQPAFWGCFFAEFLRSVHPAEFAIKDSGSDQREGALNAAVQNALRKALSEWKHSQIATAMEAPVRVTRRRVAYADVTLFPWIEDPQGGSHWAMANDRRFRVNLEVKWRVQGSIGKSKLNSLMDENAGTRPRYTLVFFFHPEESFNLRGGTEVADSRTVIYAKSEPRSQANLGFANPHLALVVIRAQWPHPERDGHELS